MKHSVILFSLLLIPFLSIGISAQTFTSALNGVQEMPPNNSSALGVGTVILNEAETNITVSLYFSTLSGAQTSAKIQNQSGIIFNLPVGIFSQNFAVTPAQAAELKAGLWYFNITSTNFPNGEIRGQIAPLSTNNAVSFPFSNGSLDTTFDSDGIVTTEISGGINIAQAVAVQTDGKLIVAGFNRSLNNDFAVVRYNPDGSLDTTFDGDSGNGNGIVTTPIGTGEEEAFAVAIQPDGKILLAGEVFNGANSDICVVRYNPNGTLDTTFGGVGFVTTASGSGSALARTIAVQTDGKIIVAGQNFNGANNDIAVVRYNPTGSLDTTFDGNSGTGNGIVTTAIGTATDTAYGVAIQTDGKIVVAGYFTNVLNNDAVILRYDMNGVLDPNFDSDGIVIAAAGTNTDEAFAVALQTDGKIVIAGCTNNSAPNDFLIGRFNTDGSPDTNYGTNGLTVTPIGGGADFANSVAIQADGKIVAAGFTNNGANTDFGVVRQNPDGSPDMTFDNDGKLADPVGVSTDTGFGIAIQADGKIVVVGRAIIGASADFGIVRYGYGTNAPTNDGFFSINSAVQIRFDNAFASGATLATTVNSLAFPTLPSGLNLLTGLRNIQTSANFAGDVLVKFTLPSRIDAANFNAAQILHFENGTWIERTANAPQRDFTTRTIYASVSSLSVFAIVSQLAQTPDFVPVAGRILSSNGKSVAGANVTFTDTNGQTRFALTNPFGYFRFRDVALRGTYIFNASSKQYKFSRQILTINDEIDNLNFTSSP